MDTDIREDGSGPENPVIVIRPSPRLRLLYLTYLALAVWVGVIPFLLWVAIYLPSSSLPVSVAAFALVLFIILVIRKSCNSLLYRIGKGEVVIGRDLPFARSIHIDCRRITAASIRQGPLQKVFRISTVVLTIAGSMDPAVPSSLKLRGIANPEEVVAEIRKCQQQASAAEELQTPGAPGL